MKKKIIIILILATPLIFFLLFFNRFLVNDKPKNEKFEIYKYVSEDSPGKIYFVKVNDFENSLLGYIEIDNFWNDFIKKNHNVSAMYFLKRFDGLNSRVIEDSILFSNKKKLM